MAVNATESDTSSLTSTQTVFHGDVISLTASFSSEMSSSQHSSTELLSRSSALLSGSSATLHNDVPSTTILQDSLASSHSAFSTVHHAISQSVSSTSQPLSTSATPPLNSVGGSYETSNYKISSHSSSPVKSNGIDSVQLTSNISPSSSVVNPSSSYIPPLLPITTAATNGSVSATPSSLTDNLTLILGMSLCGVGLLILLIIVLFVCCKKRSSTKQQTIETVQIGDLWASNRGDISYAPTFDSVLDTVSESPKVQTKTSKDVLYHVLYPYTAQEDSQLNLDLGDVVTLIEKRGNGWWKGRIKDKEGWFPGSYVEETDIGKVYTSNLHLPNGHSPVSSFLKNQDLTPKLAKSSLNRNSAPVFSYDKKALGKEVSIPKVPTPTSSPFQSPPASKPTSPSHIPHSFGKVITENVGGRSFYALYSHEPNFSNELQLDVGDVVIGIERDMNGWMKGRKNKSEEIGMFPAIYVQEISQNEEPLGYKDKQSVYDQLPVCNNDLSTAEYIGVEHTAVCPYAAENETDLSFDIGDTIIVCQTLDNGWWYGCYDDQFGWFPGSYVEMTADEIDGPVSRDVTQEEEITHDDIPDKIVIHDVPLETTIDKDIAALSPIKPLGGHRSEDEISQKSTESLDQRTKVSNGLSKDSPNKRSKLPKSVRPSRPAPPPPTQHHSTPESKTNLMEKFNKTKVSNSVSKNNSQNGKPEVPKRYIKPKLCKVPKTKTKAGNESELCRRKVRSPPPPRPDPPKLLKEKYMIRQEKANSVYPDLKDVNSTPNVSQTDVDTSNIKYANETGNESHNDNNDSAILPDDTQNVTSFLENTATTDTSLGKISGLTSLSSSVQGDRTHDQSELTSVSAINMSDMNDSRQLVNRQNSMDNSQSDEISASIGNQNVICEPSVEHSGAMLTINGDILDHHVGNQKPSHKSDSRLPCKLPQPKSHSMRDDSPKPTFIPKSQSLRCDGPKPPPVAPKPNKNYVNSHYDGEPGYSEVGTSLVGEDVVDGPDKISFYQRPLSPIYSKIDKKYIVPNQKNSINSIDRSFNDPELNNEQKSTNEIIENKGTEIDNHIQENGLENAHISEDSDQKMADISGSLACDATEESSVSGPKNVSENRPSQDNGPKTSSIPGPAHSYQSNIPKRMTSPAVKNKQLHGNTSIPKPNFSPTTKTHIENVEESENENKSKPERPSRPPNVVRHSSMTSPSPSRLPKVEKSKSSLSDSPNVSRKFQKQKPAKERGKISSAIPKSPKQKAPNPMGSSRTASSPSRLPRKAMNGVVSPKPKRPPPPKTPPTSPVTDSPKTITFSPNYSSIPEGGHLQINDTGDNRQNEGSLLKKAITSYTAQNEDELSFQEGSFIQEISQDDESGVCVGMLPNGDTGLYHKSFVEDSCHEQQSVV
ncbi:serine-rich adhesin for platelets-like isoform X6 [Mytilus edulis]|uniref:serine-rich adhesin for platelets-like isoform X6 n=1 Tax=Mytilus edulis TaxID=6550 RepID=UPI0039EEB636